MIYTKRQFAELLTISVKGLERIMFTGRCQYHRVGRRVIFTQDDLDDFLKSCACPAKTSVDLINGNPPLGTNGNDAA